jgi:hypothetical protein
MLYAVRVTVANVVSIPLVGYIDTEISNMAMAQVFRSKPGPFDQWEAFELVIFSSISFSRASKAPAELDELHCARCPPDQC